MFSYTAPIIDKKTMEAFRSNSDLQKTLGQAFERMMSFYGFEVVSTPESAATESKVGEDAVEENAKGQATEVEGK